LGGLALKQLFRGVLRDFITARAQKHHYYNFRCQNGPQIRIPVSKNDKDVGNWAFKRHIKSIFGVFRDFITAHVQKNQ